MLATVEDGVEACLHIFLQYVLPTKFPEGLSTEEEWKAFLEYISPNGESLDEEATGAGLVKLVSGRFLERFQIQLSVADGKARFHQIKTDVEKGDLRLLRIAPAAASVFCRKANESEAEYQSRVRKRVTDKHVAESKTTAVGLFDLLLTAIEELFKINGSDVREGFHSLLISEGFLAPFLGLIANEKAQWEKEKHSDYDYKEAFDTWFRSKSIMIYMSKKEASPKYMLVVVGYMLLIFWAARRLEMLKLNLRNVRAAERFVCVVRSPTSLPPFFTHELLRLPLIFF